MEKVNFDEAANVPVESVNLEAYDVYLTLLEQKRPLQ